jgi:hypothetical protein
MSQVTTGETELVVRVIFRLPAEVQLPVAAADFVRRNKVRGKNQPEPGISLLRMGVFKTHDAMYQYVGAYRKAMGAAQTTLGRLTGLGFRYVIDEHNPGHISLRCAECNMGSTSCTTNNQLVCPLFNSLQTQAALAKQFILVDTPQLRAGRP